jgi:hypothetical protein
MSAQPAPNFWEARAIAELDDETALPAKAKLREDAAAYKARLLAGLERLDHWKGMEQGTQSKTERALKELLSLLIDATVNQHQALPKTSICICPGCQRVYLPSGIGAGTYHCRPCARLWGFHRSLKPQPLPMGFWAKHLPGDVVAKKLLSDEQKEAIETGGDPE